MKIGKSSSLAAAAVLALALGTAHATGAAEASAPASAPAKTTDKPAAVAKYREGVMKGMASHLGSISMISSGAVSYKDQLTTHTDALLAVSKIIPSLFPAGTDPKVVKSESKAALWKEWDRFVALSQKMEQEATKLSDVAKTGDLAAVRTQLEAVKKACADCHDPYRIDD